LIFSFSLALSSGFVTAGLELVATELRAVVVVGLLPAATEGLADRTGVVVVVLVAAAEGLEVVDELNAVLLSVAVAGAGFAATDARLDAVVEAVVRLAMPFAVLGIFFFSSPEVSEVLPASASDVEALVEVVRRRADVVAGTALVGGLLMLLPTVDAREVAEVVGLVVLDDNEDLEAIGRLGGSVEGVALLRGAAVEVLLVATGDRGIDFLTSVLASGLTSGLTFSVTSGAGVASEVASGAESTTGAGAGGSEVSAMFNTIYD
jgi:hypothetical protein